MSPGPKRANLISLIMPKTLVGLATYVLLFAAGMAASGVALFAFYQYRVSSLEQRLLNFNEEFDTEFRSKVDEFEALAKDSKAQIEKAAKGVGSKTNEVIKLLEGLGDSIARVEGLDPTGRPVTGTAFVVTSTDRETWLLTALDLVAGSIAKEQDVRVAAGAASRSAVVWSWDDSRDLALLILRAGGLPAIPWAKSTPAVGSRIWGLSASPGRFKAAAADGHLLDTSPSGILADVDMPRHAAGGPLLNRNLKVIGVMTLAYSPAGFPPSNGWAVPIRLACQRVLRCPG